MICDVTRPNTSSSIIPEKLEYFENGVLRSQALTFNSNLSEKEEASRIKKYYLGYFSAFQHIRNQLGVKPNYWISFRFFSHQHIHPNLIKKLGIQNLPDLILNTLFAVDFAARLSHSLQYPDDMSLSLSVDLNGLINPKMMFDYASHTLYSSVSNTGCQGLVVYIN